MKFLEYVLSLVLSLLLIGGAVVWTQASQHDQTARLSCRPGTSARAVVLKGMSLYPACPGVKRAPARG